MGGTGALREARESALPAGGRGRVSCVGPLPTAVCLIGTRACGASALLPQPGGAPSCPALPPLPGKGGRCIACLLEPLEELGWALLGGRAGDPRQGGSRRNTRTALGNGQTTRRKSGRRGYQDLPRTFSKPDAVSHTHVTPHRHPYSTNVTVPFYREGDKCSD